MNKKDKFYFDINDGADFNPMINLPDDGNDEDSKVEIGDQLPLLALRNTVLFPRVIIPITVGRTKSTEAIKAALKGDKIVGVISQKEQDVEDPVAGDLFEIGTYAKIVKQMKMPDGSLTIILKGINRFNLDAINMEDPFLRGNVSVLPTEEAKDELELKALSETIREKARKIIDLSPHLPKEAVLMLDNVTNDNFLFDFISGNLNITIKEKQQILEIDQPNVKAKAILNHMNNELQILEVKSQIESKVQGDINKQQRDYLLNQQLKTIQEELGQNPSQEELDALELRSKDMKWPEPIAKAFKKELKRARRTNPQVAEFSVLMNYLELMLDLPWGIYTKDNFNLKKVQGILDKDHYGLEEVKKRILEHLSVLKLKGNMKAPIICLVGPPGVGKTSLGKSIATALKRNFIRVSLGGLHDESEIRGHRKTYIGAMPGRIIQSLKKAGSSNPVFILDEIDKIGKDHRGDPSSALLEVLDPEQNDTFHDNYLDQEYDLSKVLFVATANSLNTIQPALLDRMEIIQIEGYSVEEKIQIAKKHLVEKQLVEHGLEKADVKLSENILEHIVSHYTRESGVRNLSRKIAGVMRSVAKRKAFEEVYNIKVTTSDVETYLGPTQFENDMDEEKQIPGVVVGLAWTRVGGDILFIETSKSKGSGKLVLTGNLGDVMKESATTALSYIKAHAEELDIDIDKLKEYDIHIHVPQGAIPKDGPSAGITMLSALTSLIKGIPVKSHLAMTGEITLRGKVLPVGGIKEKILAAKRAGIKEIILCKDNEKHVQKINPDFIKGMSFHFVDRMEQVLELALDHK